MEPVPQGPGKELELRAQTKLLFKLEILSISTCPVWESEAPQKHGMRGERAYPQDPEGLKANVKPTFCKLHAL